MCISKLNQIESTDVNDDCSARWSQPLRTCSIPVEVDRWVKNPAGGSSTNQRRCSDVWPWKDEHWLDGRLTARNSSLILSEWNPSLKLLDKADSVCSVVILWWSVVIYYLGVPTFTLNLLQPPLLLLMIAYNSQNDFETSKRTKLLSVFIDGRFTVPSYYYNNIILL